MPQQTGEIEYAARLLMSLISDQASSETITTITVRRVKNGQLRVEVYAKGESASGKPTYRLPEWPERAFDAQAPL